MIAVADVKDFSESFRAIAVLHEKLGQRHGVGIGGAKVGAEIVNTDAGGARAGQESVSGRGADRLIAVSALENNAALGEAVNIRSANGSFAITAEQRLQVIHANEENILAGRRDARDASAQD